MHGIKSFASLRSRALCLELFGDKLLVASFEDIIKSKQLADRQVDRAVLPSLRKAMHQAEIQKKQKNRRANPRALKLESERALIDLIRRRLALPVEQRCNFLRVRLPGGGSTLSFKYVVRVLPTAAAQLSGLPLQPPPAPVPFGTTQPQNCARPK